MANQTNIRISKEIAGIQKGNDLSLAVACDEADFHRVTALVVGPPGTPYEYGFFEFTLNFGADYPAEPPYVTAITTNKGRTRFNPNIYAGGKSLMSNNPYENEPGYENNTSEEDKKQQEQYCAKIRHETLRIAVIQKLETMLRIQADGSIKPEEEDDSSDEEDGASDDGRTPSSTDAITPKVPQSDPFRDLLKKRFLWYYESYLSTIETHTRKHNEGQRFTLMPFEGGQNEMAGAFKYRDLARRLIRIKEVLNEEIANWATEGLKAKERESTVAYNLQGQFGQVDAYLKQRDYHNVEVSLLQDNPFVWVLTYFGKSGTDLDGGIFRIKITLSPNFPEEQPHIKVETKIFHHRVSKDGVLCYFPQRTDEVKFHIEAAIQSLEEESPPFDPRTIVHPEASKLLWGSADDKKKYARQQRRSAQDSVEEAMI